MDFSTVSKRTTGKLLWKFRGVPSTRKVLGNGRMISLWPVRGGPVAKDGKVWFAAGVWPMEGVFVHCLDANTGKSIWINDRCGFIYGTQPHNAKATGGLAPQGYLLLDGDDLIVPSSVAFPARFDAATGKLKEFELPSQGRLPGGWFASTASEKEKQRLQRRGLLFDSEVNVSAATRIELWSERTTRDKIDHRDGRPRLSLFKRYRRSHRRNPPSLGGQRPPLCRNYGWRDPLSWNTHWSRQDSSIKPKPQSVG